LGISVFGGVITKNNPLCFITALKITSTEIIMVWSSQRSENKLYSILRKIWPRESTVDQRS